MKFLEKHGREAVNALFYEMTDEEILELEREDGYLMGHEAGVKEGVEAGRIEGREEGREEGINALISACEDFGADEDTILKKLCEKFSMEPDEAAAARAQYKKIND